MSNMAPIGPHIVDKLIFLSRRRFAIAFENSSSPGYTTEKLPEALLAGTVPIYWGDPVVDLDFNPEAFLNLANFGSLRELAGAVVALDDDSSALRRIRAQPAFPNDRLPDCANDELIFAFFETVFDTALNSRA